MLQCRCSRHTGILVVALHLPFLYCSRLFYLVTVLCYAYFYVYTMLSLQSQLYHSLPLSSHDGLRGLITVKDNGLAL
jgi:hypothetical protein